MIVLSKSNIEEIANSVISDFGKRSRSLFQPVDIDRLASDYLGLQVRYADLSEDGSILGVTAYAKCKLQLGRRQIDLDQNTVLLDLCLSPGSTDFHEGRRRFTLAHECAHQILYRYESALSQEEMRKPYACRRAFSLRELKTHEDWNEWQANALGSSLLMPEELLSRVFFFFAAGEKLTSFGGVFPPKEYRCLVNMSRFLGVSHTALSIRLKQLGYLDERGTGEAVDPLDNVS